MRRVTHRLARLACLGWLALAAPACRPPAVEPPYAAGQAPAPAQLLAAVAPRISALQVPAAKVRIGRAPAGNLMFLAQKPGRFSGQVQIAGRELVSLAFHEQGYTLRNVAADGLPTGFYAGPPADCAIRQLIGVPFATTELTALVLGGAPQIDAPFEVIAQTWDRRSGHEVLRLRGVHDEQEFRFAWVAGAWWVAGSTLWTRGADGALARVWTLLHEDLRAHDGTVLPARTRISRPSVRREERVVITYNQQLPDPDLGDDAAAEADDGGWEDEEAPADAGEGAGEGAEAPPAPPASPPPAPKIPPQFTLDSAGLTPRGDLCRR
jgi:hypothetical protein